MVKMSLYLLLCLIYSNPADVVFKSLCFLCSMKYNPNVFQHVLLWKSLSSEFLHLLHFTTFLQTILKWEWKIATEMCKCAKMGYHETKKGP